MCKAVARRHAEQAAVLDALLQLPALAPARDRSRPRPAGAGLCRARGATGRHRRADARRILHDGTRRGLTCPPRTSNCRTPARRRASTLLPGFDHPVDERPAGVPRRAASLRATPAGCRRCRPPAACPRACRPPLAALLLTLADPDTPVWLPADIPARARAFLRFHCGCPLVDHLAAGDASSAVPAGHAAPSLAHCAPGDPAYPDRSATLLIEVRPRWPRASALTLGGPGIRDHAARCRSTGLPRGLPASNGRRTTRGFPLGVDLLPDARRPILRYYRAHPDHGWRTDMYVAVKGGERAILNSYHMLDSYRRGDTVAAGTHARADPRADAAGGGPRDGRRLALRPPPGRPRAQAGRRATQIEAIFLLRAYAPRCRALATPSRSTLARMRLQRRISVDLQGRAGRPGARAHLRLHAAPAGLHALEPDATAEAPPPADASARRRRHAARRRACCETESPWWKTEDRPPGDPAPCST